MPRSSVPGQVAAVCLGLLIAWFVITLWQVVAVSPWDQGGTYVREVTVVQSTAEAVIVVVLGCWLIGKSRILEPA